MLNDFVKSASTSFSCFRTAIGYISHSTGVHIMMTSSNGIIFHVTGHLCREFTGEFPAHRPVTQSFDVFFGLCRNKRLSKQSWGWWFETPFRSSWRHCNAEKKVLLTITSMICILFRGWHHGMKMMFASLSLCEGSLQVTVRFPWRMASNTIYDLIKLMNKQSWGRWFGSPWCSSDNTWMQPQLMFDCTTTASLFVNRGTQFKKCYMSNKHSAIKLTHLPLAGAAYMSQWIESAFVQIMACRIFGAKPLAKPMLGYRTLRNKLQWNFNKVTQFFIHENASENIVCEMVAILSRGRWIST